MNEAETIRHSGESRETCCVKKVSVYAGRFNFLDQAEDAIAVYEQSL